jgi:hypothetical protein
MRFVPLLSIADMRCAVKFYTEILDFEVAEYDKGLDSPVIDLLRDGAKMQLCEFDGTAGSP